MSTDNFEMPQYVIDRIMNKRGRLHVFEALQPEKTALVVLDMQNAFVKGKVKAETALAIMPNINQLAATHREHRGHVTYDQHHADDSPQRVCARPRQPSRQAPGSRDRESPDLWHRNQLLL